MNEHPSHAAVACNANAPSCSEILFPKVVWQQYVGEADKSITVVLQIKITALGVNVHRDYSDTACICVIYLRQRSWTYMRCLSICLCARLLKNACVDLDEMLPVDRCRDANELINF